MAKLAYKNLCVDYDNTRTVDDVSFSVSSGQIVGLVGESGCGKSTILRSTVRLLDNTAHISSGAIYLDDENLVDLAPEEMRALRGNRISVIFQDYNMSFSPTRTIRKHLFDAVGAHGLMSKRAAEERILELFDRLNLHEGKRILDSYTFELSGGMNQRVAIAFAMLSRPDFLLADEPTSALDVTSQSQVIDELIQMRDLFQCGMLVITHNIGVVRLLADQMGVVYAGKLVEFGATKDVLGNPLHPYTQALLDSVPTLGGTIPQGIEGTPPNFSDVDATCRFATRCKKASQHCFDEPVCQNGSDNHWALCLEVR